MFKKILTVIVFVLFSSSFVSASEITIGVDNFSINLVGGDSKNITFTATANGFSKTVTGQLSYTITQENGIYNGSEMWIEFPENPMVLEPNQPKTSFFTIKTVPNIMPDTYNIDLKLTAENEEDTSSGNHPGYGGIVNIWGDGEC